MQTNLCITTDTLGHQVQSGVVNVWNR